MTYIGRIGNYLTVVEAADRRGVARATVQRWLEKGGLNGVKLGSAGWIIYEDDLMSYVPRKVGRRKGNNDG